MDLMKCSPPQFNSRRHHRTESPLVEPSISNPADDEYFHSPQLYFPHDRARSWEAQGPDSLLIRREQTLPRSIIIAGSSEHSQYSYGHAVPPPAYSSSSFESYGINSYPHPHFVVSGPIITYPFATSGMQPQSAFYPPWGPPPTPVEFIRNIKSSDVLCGRGGATNSHSGNRSFRSLVKRHQDRYLRAKKRDKPSVAAAIVDLVRDRGGRFLRRHETSTQGEILWVDIGDERAREKTCQALREGAPELRRRRGRGASSSSDDEDKEDSPRQKRKLCGTFDEDEDGTIMQIRCAVSPKNNAPSLEANVHPMFDVRDDLDCFGDDASVKIAEEGPLAIRPCDRLMRRSVREIAVSALSEREQQLYLNDFLPPHPDIRETNSRRNRVVLMARDYNPACSSDTDIADDASECWGV